MDRLHILPTADTFRAVSYVFEADIALEYSSPFQIWFLSGGHQGIQIGMFCSGGKVMAYHGRHSERIDLGVAMGEWFKLGVEYYILEGKNIAKIFVNGSLVYTVEYHLGSDGKMNADVYIDGELYTTDIVEDGEEIINNVTKVDLRVPSTSAGVAYIDDVRLVGSLQEYAE